MSIKNLSSYLSSSRKLLFFANKVYPHCVVLSFDILLSLTIDLFGIIAVFNYLLSKVQQFRDLIFKQKLVVRIKI